jgi:hypothetical protein
MWNLVSHPKGRTKRVSGRKRQEVTGRLRQLHNEDLQHLCSSPDVIKVIKSMRISGAEQLAGEIRI